MALKPDIFENRALLGTIAPEVRDHRQQFRAFAKQLDANQNAGVELTAALEKHCGPDAFVSAALDRFGPSVVGDSYASVRDDALEFVLAGINRHYVRNRDSRRVALNARFFDRMGKLAGAIDNTDTLAYQIVSSASSSAPSQVGRLIAAGLMSVSAPPGIAASWLAFELRAGGLLEHFDASWDDEHVVREILRMRPPGWTHGRVVIRSGQVGGHEVRVGDDVIVPLGFMQTSERYWAEGLRFDPHRWKSTDLKSAVFFPFGVGSRSCVGGALGSRFLKDTWGALKLMKPNVKRMYASRYRIGPLYAPPNFTVAR